MMKKRLLFKLIFLCGTFFIAISVISQNCISSNLLNNAHANTQHSITLFNPTAITYQGGTSVPLPTVGSIFNFTVTYTDPFFLTSITKTGTATVTTSTTSQFAITIDNSVTLPTLAIEGFIFPGTSGNVTLTPTSGSSYQWGWSNDQLLNCVPLPVTLISFTISTFNVAAGYSKLTWEIIEYDNSHYIIQRSTDAINFSDYGFEPAVGNYGSQLIYNFVVPKPNVGTTFYYRLKMLDPNGNFTFSPIRISNGAGTSNPTNFCAYTSIEGNSSICNTQNVFKVHNAGPGITWSTSFGTLSIAQNKGGGIATLSSACPSGNVIITANSSSCIGSKTLTICNPGAFSITGPANFCTSGTYTTNPVTNVNWSAVQPGSTFSCSNCVSTTLNMSSSGSETITATSIGCITRTATLSVKNVNYTSFSTTGPHQFCKNQTGTISVDQTAYPGLSNFIWGPIPTGWTKIQGGTGSNYIVLRAPNSTAPPTFNLPVTVTSTCGTNITTNHFLAVGGPGCTAFAITANPITSNSLTIIENDDNTGKPVTESSIEAIEIVNKMGVSFYKKQYPNKFSGSKLTIPVANLPNDLYIIKIYDGFEWKSYKVSVQH
jgi:hypothetical protein